MKFIDMHCDTISTIMDKNLSLKDSDRMINLNKLEEADYLLQCFAMFIKYIDKKKENYSPYEYCNEMIDRYYEEINKYPEVIKPVLTNSDIEENMKNNIISSLLTIEEGGTCEGKMENLIHFYNRGVRLMTLTWNYKNEIGNPNMDFTNYEEKLSEHINQTIPNTSEGLTEFGIEVVKKMNELGMVIDCSHAGDKTFYDVIKYSSKPIVCSHSCARSICNHVRNMSDDMLLKLKENNGVVGINFCHDFIKDDDELASIKDVVKHINYIKDLIGIDYIGLGSDFDGIENDNIELKDATYMPILVEELKNQNYTQEDIDKLTHLNVLRVLKENLK